MCERDDIDLIYVCTHWDLHTPIAVYAMEHGKHVATEVPANLTIEEKAKEVGGHGGMDFIMDYRLILLSEKWTPFVSRYL